MFQVDPEPVPPELLDCLEDHPALGGGAVLHKGSPRWGGPRAGGVSAGQPDPLSYAPLGTDGIHLARMTIPGTGQISDPDQCGTWHSSAACSADPEHWVRHIEHHCDNPSCPICWSSWAKKQSNRVSERIRGYIEASNRGQATLGGIPLAAWHKDNTRYLNHFALSAPGAVVRPDMDIDEIKELGRGMARRVGITGGVMIFHPYRINKALRSRLVAACHATARMNEEDRDKKFWELVREDALGLGSWMEYVVWGPHFHIIGFGRLPDQTTPDQKEAAAEILAGWVVKWIRHVDTERSFDGQDIQDPIASLAFYVLSHAAYIKGKKIPVWLGVTSPNALRKAGDLETLSHQVVCPVCGADVVKYGEDAAGNLIKELDQEGEPIPCRLRYHIQHYEIKIHG